MKEGKCKVDLLYEVVVLALLARLNDFTLESPKFGERRADRRGDIMGVVLGWLVLVPCIFCRLQVQSVGHPEPTKCFLFV